MQNITINILQNPLVICNGKEISFPVRRADALLYYVICQKTATRKELVSLLWDSCDNETGHKNLRNTLYALKKTLGQDLLISPRKTTIQLNPEVEIDCDYLRFMEEGDYTAYKAPFLQGFSLKNAVLFEEWADRMREKTRDQYLRYLLRRAHEAAKCGEIEKAEQYTMEYMQNDPLDEQAAVFLMQLYRSNKMYPKATRVYQRLRECLEEDLGIEPLAETTALYYEAMNEWNDTATDNGEMGAGDFLPPSHTELLSKMNHALRLFLSRPGQHTSLLLCGEAGMGKTFMLENFLARPELANVLVLKGTCYQSESSNTYKPWNSVMIAIAEYMHSRGLSLPDNIRRTIVNVFPILASTTDTLKRAEPIRQDEKTVIECILLLMSKLSRHTQTLLVFEDILWMDVHSMNLLDALLRHLGPGQLMAVMTSQDILPPYADATLRTLIEDNLLHAITLESLTHEDVQSMIKLKLGLELPAHVVQRIHDETGGNPSLLYELMNGVADYNSVDALLRQSRHLLDRRLIGLSVSARQLLDIIALFPNSAPCNMLASIYSKGPDDLLSASEELKRRSLVVEQQLEQGSSSLTITYTRLRDMIYNQQPYFKRRPLHLRIARLLAQQAEELTIGICERLSYHFSQANDAINALSYDSARFLMLAELYCAPLPVLPDDQSNFNYKEPTLDGLRELETRVTALQHRLGKDTVLTNAENNLLMAKALISIGCGENNNTLSIIDQLLKQAIQDESWQECFFAYRMLAFYYKKMFDPDQMDSYLSLGSNLANKIGGAAESAYFCLLRGEKHSLVGKYDQSIYFINEALDRFRQLHNSYRYRLKIAGAYHALGLNEQRHGDVSAACSYYKQALGELNDGDAFKGIAQIYADYGRATFSVGDYSKARDLFYTAFSLANQACDLPAIAVSGAYIALFAADNYDDAASSLSQARKAAIQADMPFEQGIVYAIMAQLRQRLDMEKARDNALDLMLNRPLDVYCRKGLRFLENLTGAFERDALNACLRYSNTKSRPFTVPELYSKNKHFMTE